METGIDILYDSGTNLMDIIFIHGIGGNPTTTWKAKDSSESWPEALLPHEIPEARILSWGYDGSSSLPSNNSINQLSLLSRSLLRDLLSVRQDTKTQNTGAIFICHSLGGLICKRMLLDSKNSPHIQERSMWDLTRGIFFFGTPHGPSSDLTLKSLSKILSAVGGKMDPTSGTRSWLHQLAERSDELGRQQESFMSLLQAKRQVGRPLSVISFVETETTLGTSLVDSKSSELEGGITIHLPGNHHSMVKFAQPDDLGYQRFVNSLRQLLKDIEVPESFAFTTHIYPDSSLLADVPACVKSLSFAGMNHRPIDIAPAMQETCKWIFQNVNYQRWLLTDTKDEAENILWIKGKPGAGKSTLAKHLLAELHGKGFFCLHYFFTLRGRFLQRSAAGCYRSFLCQMLQKKPNYCIKLLQEFRKKSLTSADSSSHSIQWSLLELSQLFYSTMRDIPAQDQTFIIVDGLDECEEHEVRQFVMELSESSESWVRLGKHINICLLSRHYPTIRAPRALEVHFGDDNFSDIELYVQKALSRELRGELATVLGRTIVERSNGRFLWATLAVRELQDMVQRGTPIAEYHETLEKLPAEIRDVYFEQLSCRGGEWNRKDFIILQCCMTAESALRMSTIGRALHFSDEEGTVDALNHFFAVSAQLFQEDSGDIRAIHTSAREIFLEPKTLALIRCGLSPGELLQEGHRTLLSVCLDSLVTAAPSNDGSGPSANPIFSQVGAHERVDHKGKSKSSSLSEAEEYALWSTFVHFRLAKPLELSDKGFESLGATRNRLHRALRGWRTLFQEHSINELGSGPSLYESVIAFVGEHSTWFDLLPEDTKYVRGQGDLHADTPDDSLPKIYSEYSDLRSIRAISENAFAAINHASEVKSELAAVNISSGWQMASFLNKNFSTDQKIESILVIVGQTPYVQGLTCGEYVKNRWPSVGIPTLHMLDSLRPQVTRPTSDKAPATLLIIAGTKSSRDILELRKVDWREPDKLGEGEISTFQAWGPIERLLDFIEILAWLSAALRHVDVAVEGLMSSDVRAQILRQEGDPTLSCILWPSEFMKPVMKTDASCWHGLFKRTVIVNSPRISPKLGFASILRSLSNPYLWYSLYSGAAAAEDAGLDIDMSRMAVLAAADTLTDYEGGLIFFGYSTILVPVKWSTSGALQWHLLREENGRRIPLWRIAEEVPNRIRVMNAKALHNAPRHILGLWPNATIMLGTKAMENTEISRAEAKEKKFTIFLKSFALGLGSGGLGYGGPTASATFEVAETQRRYDPKDQKIVDLLIDFKKEPIILYDPDPLERRAWLVPKLSVLLQAVHFYTKSNSLTYQAPFATARADAGESAWEALKGHLDEIIESGGDRDDSKFILSDLLKRMSVNMRRMEKKPVSKMGFGRVIGYDLADLSIKPDLSLRKTEYAWTSPRQGWYFFTTRLPVLICSNLGDLVCPVTVAGEQTLPPFPKRRDQLAAPIRCLDEMCKDGLGNLANGRLDANWEWHSPHTPFGDCHCPEAIISGQKRLSGCEITQYVFQRDSHQSQHWAGASVNKDGVVVFGKFSGKRLQRGPRSSTQHGPNPAHNNFGLAEIEAPVMVLPLEAPPIAEPVLPQSAPRLHVSGQGSDPQEEGSRQNVGAATSIPTTESSRQLNGSSQPGYRAAAAIGNGGTSIGDEDDQAEMDNGPQGPLLARCLSDWERRIIWTKAFWALVRRKIPVPLLFLMLLCYICVR